jgi:2-polyprenyl-3-methyl-5-hydroxy-6-metoxy-1,4-benzoquinol methylase
MKSKGDAGYNERLFKSGLRRYLHMARFRWLNRVTSQLGCKCDSVIELGCFDGKSIDYFCTKPTRYKGFDANWEGGLDLAKKKWKYEPNYSFVKSMTPYDMRYKDKEKYDVGVIMETLEHVPPEFVSPYLAKIAEHLDGYLFITIPNETGIVFLVKFILKRIFTKDKAKYSFPEIINAVLGRMEFVSRNEHKGFDYRVILGEVKKEYKLISVYGIPWRWLPLCISYSIGIVAETKKVG